MADTGSVSDDSTTRPHTPGEDNRGGGTSDLPVPAVGTFVLDIRRNQLGVVMDRVGRHVQLRPEHGGREWDADPHEIRPVTATERLWPRVHQANRRGAEVRR